MLRRSAASKPARFKPDAVDGARRRPVPFGDRERHDVLVRERAGRHERVRAEPRELRDAGQAADERVVLDRHVARELRAVDDDDVIGELAVVADVRVGHDEVVVADARDAAAFRRADVDADELADPIVRADRERRVRAAVVAQVLRRPAEHGAVLNAVVARRSSRARSGCRCARATRRRCRRRSRPRRR